MTETVLVVVSPDGPVLADPSVPLVRADDAGLLRGESVFETMRVASGRAFGVEAHLSRLARSAARLALEVPPLDGLLELALGQWDAPDGVLRVVVTRGGTAFALLTELPASTVAQRAGVSAVVLDLGVPADLRAASPWLLGGVKSTSYAVNMAALREAAARGADDVVFCTSDGEVLEGPTSTCAWVTDGVLVTPPPDEVAILPGTTMHVALSLLQGPYEVRRGTVEELRAADEVLLLSSVRGVAPVVALDGVRREVGPVGAHLREAFEAAVQG
ncbi:MAG: Branched-chain amino acid aminotransferase/4-amino-4-deoxychorismate lyase [Frankiales bacterium]|nr:Branched-chain amino acid aminotransferase/4-amino-4-deoxychorismate lyase [Frankiales bacterium]